MNFVKPLRRQHFFNLLIILSLFFSNTKSIAQLKTNNKTISGSGQFGGASIITPRASELKKTTNSIEYAARALETQQIASSSLAATERASWRDRVGPS